MATSNCSIIGQKGRGGNTYGTAAVYIGYGGSSPKYYEYVLSFTTGNFTGTSNSITFNIKMYNSSQANNTTRTYRWALLSSDANALTANSEVNYYYNTHSVVEDENQLAQGTITWGNIEDDTHKVLTVETAELKGNTNYFLVVWASTTNPTSLATVSALQYQGDIVVDYIANYIASVAHYLTSKDNELTKFAIETAYIEIGGSWTPTAQIPPSTHTNVKATFKAWTNDWSAYVGGGLVGVDYITVNQDINVEVYYPLAETGSYIYYNDNGTAVRCEVYYNDNGSAIRCDVYYNDNGVAVKT